MSNETFPLQSSTATTPGSGTTIVGQLDLSELEDVLPHGLTNPAAIFEEGDASRPPPANPTAGPHRYTIYVPHDEGSRLNMGAPHHRQGDTGITMETKTHFHVFTYDGGNKTCLSLGGPTVKNGFQSNSSTSGYSLQTAGHSNHVAKHDLSLSSQEGHIWLAASKEVDVHSYQSSISLHAKQNLVETADGYVSISAGVEGAPPDVGAWDAVQALGLIAFEVVDFAHPAISLGSDRMGKGITNNKENINMFKNFASKEAKALAEYVVNKSATGIDKVLTHATTLVGLALKFKKTWKKQKEGEAVWVKATATLWKHIPDLVKEYQAIKKDLKSTATAPAPGDFVVSAKNNATITADGSVNLSGVKGVTLNGFRGVTIGGLTGTMKAHKSVSISGGMGATVSSLVGSVSMSSDLNTAEVKAKKSVTVTSEAEKVSVTGEQDVQLNSVSGCAFIHGKAGSFVGAGDGNGMGMVVKSVYMTLGKHANVTKFKDAVNKEDFGVIKIKDKSIKTSVTPDSWTETTPDQIEVSTKKVIVTAKANVEIKGKKVLLG